MIYRSRTFVACPQVLADVNSPAAIERAKAVTYYTGGPPPSVNMTFRVYKRPEVKEALNTLFAAKCAYCESVYVATQGMDVEHFRPKGEVRTAAGATLPIGYWWRASSWENLLPSCNDCNRERWHKVGSTKFIHGKHNKFPLASPNHASDEASIVHEVPLLLDPSSEDPARHLGFRVGADPVAYAKVGSTNVEDPKGRTSIDTYGLNRPGLVQTRKTQLQCFRFALRSMEKNRIQAEKFKSNKPEYDAKLAEWKHEMREVISLYLYWKRPYAALCRAYYAAWKKELEDRLVQMGTS